MPKEAKACGDHLLIRDRAREQAQPEGEAIQGGDGGFGNDRIIEGEVLLDYSRDHGGSLRGEPAAPDLGRLMRIPLQGPLHTHGAAPRCKPLTDDGSPL
jgi:hypothetical protein